MGCRKVFTDRRVFMFNNTLMEVSSFKAYKVESHRSHVKE